MELLERNCFSGYLPLCCSKSSDGMEGIKALCVFGCGEVVWSDGRLFLFKPIERKSVADFFGNWFIVSVISTICWFKLLKCDDVLNIVLDRKLSVFRVVLWVKKRSNKCIVALILFSHHYKWNAVKDEEWDVLFGDFVFLLLSLQKPLPPLVITIPKSLSSPMPCAINPKCTRHL